MQKSKKELIQEVKQIQKEKGGTIFAIPVEPGNPFSDYALIVNSEQHYHVFPTQEDINTIAVGVKATLETMQKEGIAGSYEDEVRFVMYEPQTESPILKLQGFDIDL